MVELRVARTMFARVRGLLGTPRSAEALLLVPCCDIHTFGMRYAIDIAFIDGNGHVLKAYRNLEPGCRLRCRAARAALERAACPWEKWFAPGDFAGLMVKIALEERSKQ